MKQKTGKIRVYLTRKHGGIVQVWDFPKWAGITTSIINQKCPRLQVNMVRTFFSIDILSFLMTIILCHADIKVCHTHIHTSYIQLVIVICILKMHHIE